MNLRPSRSLRFESHPPDHILTHIQHGLTGRSMENSDRFAFFIDAYRQRPARLELIHIHSDWFDAAGVAHSDQPRIVNFAIIDLTCENG